MINILLFIAFLYFLRQYVLQNQYITLLCDERVHLSAETEKNQKTEKKVNADERKLIDQMDTELQKFCKNFIKN